jgi:hypothetical protein
LTSHTEEKKTYQPLPEGLNLVLGRGIIVGRRLDLLDVGDEVHLVRCDPARAEGQPRREVEDREQDEREVVRDKRVHRPLALEENVPPRELGEHE